MMSRPRATSSRINSTGSSSRSATRCIWGVTTPWRAKYIWVMQVMPTPSAGFSRIRFKGSDLSPPTHWRAPLSTGNLRGHAARCQDAAMLSQSWRRPGLIRRRSGSNGGSRGCGVSCPDRREFITALSAALLTSLDRPGARGSARPPARSAGTHPFRIRTVTAGVRLDSAADMRTIESAISFLDRTRKAYADAGYEVQTIRVATQPLTSPAQGVAVDRLLADIQALDRAASEHGVL